MNIHHIRNATFIIETTNKIILIDPMLSSKGKLPPFSYYKHKAQNNPTVDLPSHTSKLLNKVTSCLITHSKAFGIRVLQHTDHLDPKGEEFLKRKKIHVGTIKKDASYLRNLGLNVSFEAEYYKRKPYFDGFITAIPAQHGKGWIHRFMANGAGYFIELPNEPSIFISGDTILTPHIKRAITKFQPDLTVVACGHASMDLGKALLMDLEEIIEFIKLSPKEVYANHMEALNHCSLGREDLRARLDKENLLHKVYIPNDGDEFLLP